MLFAQGETLRLIRYSRRLLSSLSLLVPIAIKRERRKKGGAKAVTITANSISFRIQNPLAQPQSRKEHSKDWRVRVPHSIKGETYKAC